MYKAMTLLDRDSTTPMNELVAAVISRSDSQRPSLALTLSPAAALYPEKPPPPGGAITAYFDDADGARGWKAIVDEQTGGAAPTAVVAEHVVRGHGELYADGRRLSREGFLKVVAFLQPIPKMSTAAFGQYWLGGHAQLADEQIPAELRSGGYVQNHAVDEQQPYAAVAESYWENLAALRAWSAWYGGEGGAELRADEENFLDAQQRIIMITTEKLIIAGAHQDHAH